MDSFTSLVRRKRRSGTSIVEFSLMADERGERIKVETWSGPRDRISKLFQSPWMLPIIVSTALVIPCFWQPIVSGVDLQSHLYNAWLAELIRSGSIHGLWIGHQSTNLLVDLLLSGLLKIVGVSGAERVVAVTLVLIFFWGGFQFISAVRGQAVYWVTPWLAILSYGFVFQDGLLNYYLSCGIVLWLFAILWRQPAGWRILWAGPFLILAYTAHPLPVLWFLGLAAYCQLAQRLHRRFQPFLFFGSAILVFLIRSYVVMKYNTIWMPRQLIYWTGADQALLFGWLYLAVAIGFLIFSFSLIVLREPKDFLKTVTSVPGQAYFLTAVAIVLIPSAIQVSVEQAWASRIADRLSLLSGVLLLSVVSCSVYRRWYLPAGLAASAIFFGAVYADVGRQARSEAKMQQLLQALPPLERVVYYDRPAWRDKSRIPPTGETRAARLARRISNILTERLNSTHLLSRACLGYCFDYMNYEPSTGQFRIHAAAGNSVVVATYTDFSRMMDGTYLVKANDPPLYEILSCGAGPDDIRLRRLATGESVEMLALECDRSTKTDPVRRSEDEYNLGQLASLP
jgi:hypothetical protein